MTVEDFMTLLSRSPDHGIRDDEIGAHPLLSLGSDAQHRMPSTGGLFEPTSSIFNEDIHAKCFHSHIILSESVVLHTAARVDTLEATIKPWQL